MVSVSESAAKTTAASKTIKVKDVYIKENMLCDDEGNDVLTRIAEQMPDPTAPLKFNIKFDISND